MGYIAELRKYIGHQPILMPAGCAMILNEKKQLLLQKRADNGCWAYPGGAVELGESFEECAVREVLEETVLKVPGITEVSGFRIRSLPAREIVNTPDTFTVCPVGKIMLRSRQSGDSIRLSGGSKSLKKLFIDRKIPAAQRDGIPILCDEAGILGIPGIGVNLDRAAKTLPATRIQFHL